MISGATKRDNNEHTYTQLQLENTRNRFLLEMFALVLAGATIKACDSKLITPLSIQLYANKNIISKALAPKLCYTILLLEGGPSLYYFHKQL